MTIAMPPLASVRKPRPMPAWKIAFYRQCRLWHGWLSAFAFIALMFFSATGLLLNHPEWLAGQDGAAVESHARLNPPELKAKTAPALAALLKERKLVQGVYASGDIDEDMALLRFEGVTGNTSVSLDLTSGEADIAYRKATALTVLNDLHRGKNAGTAWKWLIDVSAGIFLLLSLIGYILFFSMRHRLPQVLLLTLGSIGILVGLFLKFVP
jgi:uncharacterized protein